MTIQKHPGALALFIGLAACSHGERTTRPTEPPVSGRSQALTVPEPKTAVDQQIARLAASARREPRKVAYWVALGQAWIRKARESADPGYYVNANDCAMAAVEVAPQSPLALDLRALVRMSEHRFAEAQAIADAVLHDHPDDAMALGTRSDAALERGDFRTAALAAEDMLALKPNLPSYTRASYLHFLQGDVAPAREAIRLALDAAQDDRDREPRAWTLVQAALLFFHEGDYTGAEYGLDQALALVPDYPPALVAKARLRMGVGDPARAIPLLERAEAQSPLVETAILLGDARTLAGDSSGAEQAYARVERQGQRGDPRTLAYFLAREGRDPARALVLVEDELRGRGDTYTRDVHALALLAAGRVSEARAEIDRATALGTRDARLYYHAGLVRLAQGQQQSGRRLIRRALELDPRWDAVEATHARTLLKASSPI
jgi:tetratricopeptide (TPR) repeat protein